MAYQARGIPSSAGEHLLGMAPALESSMVMTNDERSHQQLSNRQPPYGQLATQLLHVFPGDEWKSSIRNKVQIRKWRTSSS